MTKLTDTQLIVLSKAAQRDDSAAVVPERMGAAAAKKVGDALVSRKLMREIRAKPGMPVWHKDEEDRPMSLVILRAGRDAIGVEDEGGVAEPEVAPARSPQLTANPKGVKSDAAPRAGSKQALVIAMLSKDKGVTLDALVEATGWLPHTTRAAMTGLRKRGYMIERSCHEKLGSLYRITSVKKQTAA